MKALVLEGRGGGWSRDEIQSTLHLGWSGIEVEFTHLDRAAADEAALRSPHLVVIHAPQGDASWLTVIRLVRARLNCVIVVAAESYNESHLIEAIEAGADDYFAMPLNRPLFIARVRAALRRTAPPGALDARPVRCGCLTIDPARYEAQVEDRPLELTATEFRLLFELARQSELVIHKGPLCRAIWGQEGCAEDAVLRKYIQSLRRKLAERSPHVSIVTVPRVGYKLVPRAPSDESESVRTAV